MEWLKASFGKLQITGSDVYIPIEAAPILVGANREFKVECPQDQQKASEYPKHGDFRQRITQIALGHNGAQRVSPHELLFDTAKP